MLRVNDGGMAKEIGLAGAAENETIRAIFAGTTLTKQAT
jgi:hypothetical protein